MNKDRTDNDERSLSFEKIMYLFLVLLNIIGLLTFYEFNSITVDVLKMDVLLIAIIKFEQVASKFIGSRITLARIISQTKKVKK